MARCQGSRVALLEAVSGDPYALPGVGESHNWTIPADRFRIEHIIGKTLLALERDAEGKLRLARAPPPGNEIIRSKAPVYGFVSKACEIRMYGPLAPIADECGCVFVQFGWTPLREDSMETACADLIHIPTPPSEEDRFDDE